jgi:hypothetical protein
MDHGYSLDPFGLSSRLGREVVIKAVTANILSMVHGHPSRCKHPYTQGELCVPCVKQMATTFHQLAWACKVGSTGGVMAWQM